MQHRNMHSCIQSSAFLHSDAICLNAYGARMTIREQHLEFIRQAMEATNLTASTLATAAGISTSTLTRFIANDSMASLSQVTLGKIADYVAACSSTDSIDGSIFLPAPKGNAHAQTVPIVGYVGAGGAIFPYDDHQKGQGMGEAAVPDQHSLNISKTVAVEVMGDSMMPFICEGDRLYYDERVSGVAYEFMNTRCVVWLESGRCLVKWVRQGTKAGHYNLESINPNDPLIKDALVQWSAKVKNIVPR